MMESESRYSWAALVVVSAIALAFVYTAWVASGPVTPVSVDPIFLVYAAALLVTAFSLKQAFDSRSNAGGRQIDGSATAEGRSRGSREPADADRSGGSGASGPRGIVEEEVPRFGAADPQSGGSEGDDGFGVLGSEFDEMLWTSVDYDVDDSTRNEARRRVVEELRETAAFSVSRRMETDLEDAEDRVLTGKWTDSHRAAALLSDDSGPDLSWRYRILDLLAGRDVFLSSVDDSVEEISGEEGSW